MTDTRNISQRHRHGSAWERPLIERPANWKVAVALWAVALFLVAFWSSLIAWFLS